MNKEETEPRLATELPTILALDTSSKLTSLAVARGERIIVTFGAELDDKRSARLWRLTDFLLTEVGLRIGDIDLFAACVGPGGFTGVRVGMATVKGFAAATAKPTVGVTSLEAMAAAAYPARRAMALSNAYKGEVYWQLFSFDAGQVPKPECPPSVGPLDRAMEAVKGMPGVVFSGDGAEAHSDAIMQFGRESRGDEGVQEETGDRRILKGSGFLAERIARLGFLKYAAGKTVKPDDLEACYVRGADVKIQRQV